jgi:N-acetylglutamate synthase-like GNAT family acetyltransferase
MNDGNEIPVLDYTLRSATEEDFAEIRKLIYAVKINPVGLDWRRFILAVDRQDRVIGCGQIKLHRDGSRELASIAVRENARRQGVARRIIEHLIASLPTGPLYLTCRQELGPFYERFGFVALKSNDMSPTFRRISRITIFLRKLHLISQEILVMRLDF